MTIRRFVALGVIGGWCLVGLSLVQQGFNRAAAPSRAAQLGLPSETPIRLKCFHTVAGLPRDIAQFETVFWEAADSESLRQWLQTASLEGKTVLEIGTGTGLLALCCLEAGAQQVTATDINPVAVANAAYNAELLGHSERLDVRLVHRDRPGAFAVLRPGERYDLIISNPPWEDGRPAEYADFAYFDPGFMLLDSLLRDLELRLRPDGRCLLAYGCQSAIQQVQRLSAHYGLDVQILDERPLDKLPENFLPGMLLEIRPRRAEPAAADNQPEEPS